MRKRTRVHEHFEDAIDALTPDERWRLFEAIVAERKAGASGEAPGEPRPTLH